MIKVSALSARYGRNPVLTNVSFETKPREFIGLLGPNGSGKTTLLKSLIGLTPLSNGHVEIGGVDALHIPARQRARQISYLAQNVAPAWDMSVRDVISLGRAPYRGPLGKLSGAGEIAVNEALVTTQTEGFAQRRINTLSGGEKARVLLARALAVQAPTLLADEPIAALDPYYQITIMGLLKAQAQSCKTVIAALHDLALASQFCDRVIVLHEGRIAADGPPETALTKTVLADVFGIEKPRDGFAAVSLSKP